MELVAREVAPDHWDVLAVDKGGAACLGTYTSHRGAIAAIRALMEGKYKGCKSYVERKGVK